jgi:hypothetical protein
MAIKRPSTGINRPPRRETRKTYIGLIKDGVFFVKIKAGTPIFAPI